MKLFLRVMTIIDIVFMLFMIIVGFWWRSNHNEPGLAEMINIRSVNTAIIVSAIIAIVLLVIIFVLRYRKQLMKKSGKTLTFWVSEWGGVKTKKVDNDEK